MAAIGETASMVGHDIRNPLQAIVSDVFLAKADLVSTPEGKDKEGIRESLEISIKTLNILIKSFKTF